jgi:hypothetical protein
MTNIIQVRSGQVRNGSSTQVLGGHQYYAPLTIDKAGSTASQSRGRYHRHCMLDIIILLPSVSDLQP